jgi:hypothetical protein
MKCDCGRLRFKILAKNKGETNGPASSRKLLLVKCRDCRRQYVCTLNPTESGLGRPCAKIGKAVNGYIRSAVAKGSL